MKLTRKELNLVIENYLNDPETGTLNERLGGTISDARYEVPRCDFEFSPDFLQFYDFVKAGGRRPASDPVDSKKPYMFNPAFTEAMTQQFLPFMNLMVMPTFGIKAKCDMMRKMQASFNEAYRKFESGFEGAPIKTKKTPEQIEKERKELDAKVQKIYGQYFSNFQSILTRNNIQLTNERGSGYTTRSIRAPSGLNLNELHYASFILGNLENAKYSADAKRIVESFDRETGIDDIQKFFKLISDTRNISGYDELGLKSLVTNSASTFRSNTGGANELFLITKKLFEKLKLARII